MSRRQDVTPFLPTLKRARAAGLPIPPGKPSERRPLCALVVLARAMLREEWVEQEMISLPYARRLARRPETPVRKRPGSFRTLRRAIYTKPCLPCQGRRRHGPKDSTCPNCNVVVEMNHYRDSMRSMREVYVPLEVRAEASLHNFERALESSIPKRPHETLRCLDLRPRVSGSAYRTAGHEKQPTFFGHGFGDSIDQGIEGVDKLMLRGEVVAQEVKAYAWPFMWLRWNLFEGGHEVVLFVDGKGQLRSFLGQPPAE